jgi:hypothetical protein
MHAKCICRIWSWPQLCLEVCWWSRPSYPLFQFSESRVPKNGSQFQWLGNLYNIITIGIIL